MRDPRYIEIPGSKTHELPPLLVHSAGGYLPAAEDTLASVMGEAEDMLAASDIDPAVLEQRKFELALQLVEQYKGMASHWLWGDSVLEWIRQCEITFGCEDALRKLLHPDVWPHAGRASFVTLLADKQVPTHGVALEKAVGMRLWFRELPSANHFTSQSLIYLYSAVVDSAYRHWSQMIPDANGLLPPERFHFEVQEVEGWYAT